MPMRSVVSVRLNLLQRFPDSPERIQRELLLQMTVGPALIAVKGYAAPEVERAYTRMRELCEQLGNPPAVSPVLFGLWFMHLFRGELRSAYELAEHLLLRAQRMSDRTLLLLAEFALGFNLFWLGEFPPAKEHLEMAISIYNPERHRSLAFLDGGADAGVYCLSQAAFTLWVLGYPDQAPRRGNQAVALAQRLSHPYSLAFARNFVGPVHQVRREVRAAKEHAEGVIALSAEHGYTDRSAYAIQVRGWAMAEQGYHEEGVAQIREGLAAFRSTGTRASLPYCLSMLVEACIKSGRVDDGLSALTEALAAADEQEDRSWEAEMHRLKGELLLKQNNLNAAKAQSCFERAIEVARKQSAKSFELRATTGLSRLLASQGRREEARAMIAEIYNWFTEGFDTADLKDAKALLDQLAT
jgi:predicted ATPase